MPSETTIIFCPSPPHVPFGVFSRGFFPRFVPGVFAAVYPAFCSALCVVLGGVFDGALSSGAARAYKEWPWEEDGQKQYEGSLRKVS